MHKENFICGPSLTGEHSVSRFDLVISDSSRSDPHVSNKNSRDLSLNIFFPSKNDKNSLYSYDEGALFYWKQAGYWTSEQKMILDESLKSFRCYSKIEALPYDFPSNDKPIIIFSHGFMAFSTLYSFLIEELVSHGFIVIGINHTYAASYANLGEETVYGSMTHGDLFSAPYAETEQQIWIDDCLFVIEQIKKRVHLTRKKDCPFIMMGHSFGGSTAIHVAEKSKDVKGCINLDGALFGQKSVVDFEKPCFILKAEESVREMASPTVVNDLSHKLFITEKDAERFQSCYRQRLDKLVEQSSQVSIAIINGINHMAFTDFTFLNRSPLFQQAYVGPKPYDAIIKEIREKVLCFLHSMDF